MIGLVSSTLIAISDAPLIACACFGDNGFHVEGLGGTAVEACADRGAEGGEFLATAALDGLLDQIYSRFSTPWSRINGQIMSERLAGPPYPHDGYG